MTLDTGTVMAAGDNVGGGIGSPPPCDGGSGACGTGGTISVKSFNDAISWVNGIGNVNPDRPEVNPVPPNAGKITLEACTTITTTGTDFDDATPVSTTGLCGGLPVLPSAGAGQYDVVFLKTVWAACSQATISGVKWHDLNGNHVRDLPGDVGLSGWHILVTDGGSINLDITTAADGSWSATVPSGTYTVCEVLQPTWRPDLPDERHGLRRQHPRLHRPGDRRRLLPEPGQQQDRDRLR